MYQYKYRKYKSKYHKLQRQVGGSQSNLQGGVDSGEIDLSDVGKNIINVDIMEEEDHNDPSQEIPRPDQPNIEQDDIIIVPTQEIKQRENKIFTIGSDEYSITVNIEPKDIMIANNILELNSIDDFDNFTNKYGLIHKDKLVINWPKVSKKYEGIYINDTLKQDRFTLLPYGTDTKESWLSFEFVTTNDEVVIFKNN